MIAPIRQSGKATLSRGYSGKFWRAVKDWWAQAENGEKVASTFLHAPFDNIVHRGINHYIALTLPSLQLGGYYVHLLEDDYNTYQEKLNSEYLRRKLDVDLTRTRIEIEQIIWKNG